MKASKTSNASKKSTLKELPPRERILHTAHDLFYRDGVRATGIDRVIAESGVAKLTFYRHFPSKNDLIVEFLEYRHRLWMNWFVDALQRQQALGKTGIGALVPALAEWFGAASYRGCAFINSVVELGGVLPQALEISRRHKQDMTDAIAALLPKSRRSALDAQTIALLVDGAIVRAQFDDSPQLALKLLDRMLRALQP